MKTESGRFSVSVSQGTGKDAKVLYENKVEKGKPDSGEAFEYPVVESPSDAIQFFKSELPEDDAKKENADELALNSLMTFLNSKLKERAKSNAYQSVVNKYTPVEDPEKVFERAVTNLVRIGVPMEIARKNALQMLKDAGINL